MSLYMIYNKELNITEEDVVKETDIEVLLRWRTSIESQITSMLAGVDSWTMLPDKKKTAYKYMFTFNKMIRRQIGVVRRENGWVSERSKRKDRSLSMVFMQVAKKELRKEDYARLLAIAQSEIKGD